jgi:hypothetical protein
MYSRGSKKARVSQAWWVHVFNPSTQKLKLENHKFKTSLSCIVRPCFKKKARVSGAVGGQAERDGGWRDGKTLGTYQSCAELT